MEKSKFIWMDGEFVPWDEAQVHVLTHTLHYGYGVFEGIRCYQGDDGSSAIFRLRDHTNRLFGSAHVLGIEIPFSKEQIDAACIETVRINDLKACYIRPIVFIGDGDMGLAALHNPIRVSVAAWQWGSYLGGEHGLENGIRLKTSSFHRFHVNTLMSKAKVVGHYVNSILASIEVRRAGYDEALMLDTNGFVAECSAAIVFLIRHGQVKTTPLTSVLPSIRRQTVMTLLSERGLPVGEDRFTRDELYIADEAFVTGTASEITPIRELDDRRIGSGRPGPITRELQAELEGITQGKDRKHREWLTAVS